MGSTRTSRIGRNENFRTGTVRTKVREPAEPGESGKFVPNSLGQAGQEYAADANQPVQPKQGTFVLGHPGQRDAWDAKSRSGRQQGRKVNVWP
ncbi:hypothetical protein KI387_000326, partial [Taxus chinensis]